MTQNNPPSIPGLIRITREEATSAHVDDLLKRQASLRGEGGITRDRQRKWYYQNWFVFSLVAMVAAILAWAIIEPILDDMPYYQGTITEINFHPPGVRPLFPNRVEGPNRAPSAPRPEHTEAPEDAAAEPPAVYPYVKVNDQKFLLPEKLWVIEANGKQHPIDRAAWPFDEGRDIGVYVERVDSQHGADPTGPPVDVALFVVADPPLRLATPKDVTLDHLMARSHGGALLLFPLVAGFVGLAIGAADGAVCRLWRRALLGGLVGLFVGFVGGFISTFVASIVYTPLTELAQNMHTANGLSTFGFILQMTGRGLAWMVAGMAMGLGQGIALRSWRLLLYGVLGGIVGGLLGGLLFDPLDLLLLGAHKPSAHMARLVGLAVIGLSVGAMIGIVELLARDAWLRMLQGPLAGKEFLIFKDLMHLGSSPRSEIYLFNDEQVAPDHAVIRAVGDNYELESVSPAQQAQVNGLSVQRTRLRHGDQIAIGRAVFTFNRKRQT